MIDYRQLRKSDIVEWIKPLLQSKEYTCRRADGKFEMCKVMEAFDNPWRHINHDVGHECTYLHRQLFNIISPRTPIGQFVPRRCQECWKIVIRPQTVKQLFALEQLLLRLDWPSKCGCEKRAYTPLSEYRYGGYIYNDSIEQGIYRLDLIRGHIENDPELNGIECHLKRSCTEMEMACGDSTKWSVSDEQNRIEDLLEWLIVYDSIASHQSKHIRDKVHMRWIEWAAENGDETYLEYTGGERLYDAPVRYEKAKGTEAGSPDGETVSISPTAGEVPKGIALITTEEKK